MKKLKFRAWMNNSSMIYSDSYIDLEYFFNACKKGIIQQFTGMHDKNGDEIYDGDILQSPNSIQKVYFENGCFGLKSNIHNKSNPHPLFKMNMTYWKVIGNIYQDKKLINL